jgi:hypothetical protein
MPRPSCVKVWSPNAPRVSVSTERGVPIGAETIGSVMPVTVIVETALCLVVAIFGGGVGG